MICEYQGIWWNALRDQSACEVKKLLSTLKTYQKLSTSSFIAHTSQYRGQKEAEGIQRHEAPHFCDTVCPAFPVLQCSNDMALMIFRALARQLVLRKTVLNATALFSGEECCCIRLLVVRPDHISTS